MKKDYENALQTLKDHGESLPTGILHYNLGLTYARLENWPESRFHFLAAEKAGMMNADVEQNQKLVVEKLSIGKVEKSESVTDYFYNGMKFLSGGEFTTISLLILFVGLLSIKKSATKRKFTMVILASLIPLSLALVAGRWTEVIVMHESKIQDGPSKIFGAVSDIPAGVRLITIGEGTWTRVLAPYRFRGWIEREAIKELE